MLDLAGDFSQYLFEQGRSATSAFHEFRLLFEPEADEVHVFVEGEEDILYYVPAIRQFAEGRAIKTYICGNKRSVIEARGFIRDGGYNAGNYLYFVDRDYDDLFVTEDHEDRETFITEEYSIENYIVCHEGIRILLTQLAGMSQMDPYYRTILLAFQNSYSVFTSEIESLLAWCLALRANGGRPNYNNIDLRKFFDWPSRGVVKKRTGAFGKLRKALDGSDSAVVGTTVRQWVRNLRQLPVGRRIRGKYALWFFEAFLLRMLRDGIKNGECGTRVKIPAALSSHRLFEVLPGRMSIPHSLESFLHLRLK